jgi:uncharacterized protein YbgA (DUF1722 family)/uncharacterized protein YbbK (DUF523 family)
MRAASTVPAKTPLAARAPARSSLGKPPYSAYCVNPMATPTAPPVPAAGDEEIPVGVSACLLGEKVRYDGGHKRDNYVADVLGRYFRFVPVCPELDIGLGVPRETLRLVRTREGIRMVAPASGTDHTGTMREYSKRRTRQLRELGLRGYILKKNSPSCGMTRVKTYTEAGMPAPADRGVFADALLSLLPLLPVEEEGRLNDPRLRENFIVRVFAYDRLTRLFDGRWKIGDLVEFQAREKLLLMAHAPEAQRRLGRIVADAKRADRHALRDRYTEEFMGALAKPATVRRHVNALQHMLGYFRDRLDAKARQQLHDAVEDYRGGLVPLVVPLTLIRHYVVLLDVEYLRDQTYLQPHPKELALRNHV